MKSSKVSARNYTRVKRLYRHYDIERADDIYSDATRFIWQKKTKVTLFMYLANRPFLQKGKPSIVHILEKKNEIIITHGKLGKVFVYCLRVINKLLNLLRSKK